MNKSQKSKENLLLFYISIVIFLINAYWIFKNKRNGILDIDEAGYLTMAWNNWNSFGSKGLIGYFESVSSQTLHAPLQGAVTSLLFIPFGPKIFIAIIVPIIFYVGIFIIIYKILSTTYSTTNSAYLSFFVTQLNFMVAYSRNYNFAIISSFFVILATYIVLHVRDRSNLYPLILGSCFGGILLSRTVSIIFLPFLFIVFVMKQKVEKKNCIELLKGSLLIMGAFIFITFPWLANNFHIVFDYLTNFGYGERSREYGSDSSIFSIENLIDQMFRVTLKQYSILTLFALIVIPLSSFAIERVKKYRKQVHKFRESNNRTIILGYLIITLGPFFILMSSRNKGSGFDLPIIILIHILILIVVKYDPSKFIRVFSGLLTVAQILILFDINYVKKSDASKLALSIAKIQIPLIPLNNISVSYLNGGLNGEELNEKQVREFQWLNSGIDSNFEWNKAKVNIIRFLEKSNADGQFVVITTRHRIVNPNSMNLIRAQERKGGIPFRFLPAQEISESSNTQIDRIIFDEFGLKPCTVITSNGKINEILPQVNQKVIYNKLKIEKYKLKSRIVLPDFRVFEIYQSVQNCPKIQ